jgi:hypothetical protein
VLTSHSLVAWLYTVLMVLEYKTMMRRYERDHHQALSTYRLLRALDDRRGVSTSDMELREKCGVPPEPDPRDAWINDQGVVSSKIRFVETHR